MTQELATHFRRAWTRKENIALRFQNEPDWLALWQVREHVILRAITSAKDRGNSWRNFQVGAAAFLSSKDPELLRSLGKTPQIIYTGANWKLGSDQRNTCAEQEIVAQIRQQEHFFYPKEVLMLVIAGECLHEPDRESNIFTKTLHPCNHCRKLLSETPQITPSTLIVSVNLDNTKRRIWSFESLLKIHNGSLP